MQKKVKGETIHPDITKQYYQIEELKDDKMAGSFKEEPAAKYNRLAQEFDQISDVENTEKNFIN